MSRCQRRAMIDREQPQLSVVRQCALLDISRSSLYYHPTETSAEDLELMALIDRQYLLTPFYGSRRMAAWLRAQGYPVNRKRVRRLMRIMGIEAIYQRPNTSRPSAEHRVYPYLLRGLEVSRVNQVWAADITYIPMARVSCTWWPSWTGTAAMCWPGGSPTPWIWTSAWQPWRRH